MRRKYGSDSPSLSEETKRNVYFYHHSIEDHIASLAEQAGDKNLVAAITTELVRLLEAKALWESFRHSQSLPEMRTQRNGDRTGGWPGSAPRTLAADVFSPASGHRTLNAKARKAISKAQRSRWAKFHAKQGKQKRSGWSPERRAKYSKRLKQMYADPVLGKKLRRKMNKMRLATMRKGSRSKSQEQRNYWARMTPAQRSAEMIRRREVAAAKKGSAAA